jgi:ABC-type multidrug transport system fused ATPase/permease subunit
VDEATMQDVVGAAKVAQLHDFIQSRPDGYDTLIGAKGGDLSGGERQRLAIARTVLVDPPILILDDSTASVDMGTEHLIQSALAEVIGGRTTFVISHRLATVRRADMILVLDKGGIVERGGHDELLALDGLYRRMHDLQLAPTVEEALVEGHGATSGGRSL